MKLLQHILWYLPSIPLNQFRKIKSIQYSTPLIPEYMLLQEFFLTPQTGMTDQECEQPHVPYGAEEMVQDVTSDLVWDLNQPTADVVYEWF